MKHSNILENTPIQSPIRCDVKPGTPFFMTIGFKTPSIFQTVLSSKLITTGTCISVFLIGGAVSIIGCSLIYKHMKNKYYNKDRLSQHEVDKILEMEKKHIEKKEKEKKEKEKMKHLGLCFNNYITKYTIENITTKESDFNESCFVQEFTPDGGVFMKYNVKSDVFWYWSDGMIRYRVLDTVARKFCTIFRSRQLYMDIEKEERERELEQKEKEKEKEKDTNKDIDTDIDTDTPHNSEKEKECIEQKKNEPKELHVDDDDDSFLFIDSERVKNINNRDNNKPIEEDKITLSLSNKKIYFIRKGSVRDFSHTLNEITHVPKEKQISYKDFKEFNIK